MLTPSLPRFWRIGIVVFFILFFLYSVVVMQQILLGLLLPVFLIAIGYVGWRVWRLFRMHEQKLEAETDRRQREHDEDPVETLKRRYANGELTEEAFENELEQVLESQEESLSTPKETSASQTRNRKPGTSEQGTNTN